MHNRLDGPRPFTLPVISDPAGRRVRRALAHTALATITLLAVSGCSAERILEVTDPDIINPGELQSPPGAHAIYVGALARLNNATSGQESFFFFGGLLTDEWRSGDTFVQRNETDKRDVQTSNSLVNTAYRTVNRARVAARQAIDALEQYDPNNDRWRIAEMYFAQGFTEVLMAEHLCSGIPLSTIESGNPIFSPPLTTQEVLNRASAHFDSALAIVGTATDAKSTEIRHAAQVGKGRALLALGQFAAAAAAVSSVPTGYEYLSEHSLTAGSNEIWALNTSARRYTVSPGEGTNGIPFATARDPRLPVGPRVARGSFDRTTDFYPQLKWGQESPVAIASGVEARLIEAEKELQSGGNSATFFAIHNALRARVTGLAPVADTGVLASQVGRENFHFRERAFWLFSTGHRLGDLRRLVTRYGRSAESVFPTGTFFKGGTYGTDVNLPVTLAEQNNPEVPEGGACINREP